MHEPEALANAQTVDPIVPRAWRIAEGPSDVLEAWCAYTPLTRGTASLDGDELTQLTLASQPDVPDLVGRYVALEPAGGPIAIDGRPDTIGVWVNGNGNWGRVLFELLDAKGRIRARHVSMNWRARMEPADIVPLRQSILQLGVRGRLVRQVPADEPANDLLERLRMARGERLRQETDNPESTTILRKLAALPLASRPVPLPSGWSWAHLLDVAERVVDCHNKTAPYAAAGIPIVRTSNIRAGRCR